MKIDSQTSVTLIDGRTTTMSEFAGKVLLVVNTATKCGFTPQLTGLEELWNKYKDEGLVVLGMPCPQFFQEPGNDEAVAEVCKLRYGVSFPLLAKGKVNGSDAHPLFKTLKTGARGLLGTKAIKWNFTKFLVDRSGEIVGRYATKTPPSKLETRIKELL